MPSLSGIPIIGWVQITVGAALVIYVSIKYLSRPKKKKAGEYIIRDVHVIVGDGTEQFHRNVYVKDGVIQEISASEIERKSAQILDGVGKTLMPGLIDAHVHIQGLNNRSGEDSDKFLYGAIPDIFKEKVLPYGITTIKDMCAPKGFIYKLRDEVRAGKITGPEVLIVGPNFTAPHGHPASTLGRDNPWLRGEMAIEAATPEQVHDGIIELAKAGVDFLKLTYQGGDYWYFNEKLQINRIDKFLMRQIILEGEENGLHTTAHAYYKEDVRELLEAGIYGIEHGVLDEALSPNDDIVKLWKESGARFVPTVNAMTYEKEQSRLEHSLHNLKVLFDAGIPIAMGTDTMYEAMSGDSVQKELAYYVEAGLTPMQAIVLATKNSAEHLGIANKKGLISPGMEADLILLDENPAENISNMQFIDKVFLKGKIVYSQGVSQAYDIPAYAYPAGITVLEYEKTDGKEEREVIVSGYAEKKEIIQTVYRDNAQWSREIHTLNDSLSNIIWHYSRPSDDTVLTAERENGFIRVSGTFKGKPQDKRLKIGDGLWYQMMDMAMPAFINSAQNEIIFYSIGTGDNRGAMGLGEFAAKKEGRETVSVNGNSYDCVKISLVLTMFAWAWKGFYWYDIKTGQMVQSGEKGNAKTEKLVYRLKWGDC